VAELLLEMPFVELSGRGEARGQGMSREFALPVGFGKIAAQTGGKRRSLGQAGNMPVFEAVRADMLLGKLGYCDRHQSRAAEGPATENLAQLASKRLTLCPPKPTTRTRPQWGGQAITKVDRHKARGERPIDRLADRWLHW
jgi:hypothetical protein